MWMTQGEALERVAQVTARNAQTISQENKQRRNQVVDLYGVEFYRQGDANYPATFYISISPDMIYMERFEFKLIFQSFMSTAGEVGETSLSPGAYATVNEPRLILSDQAVTPNPHTHTLTPGMSSYGTVGSDIRISVEGIDVTAYLAAQYDGWINGEGVYPTLDVHEDVHEDVHKNYDLLQVASDFVAEGREADANKLTRSGYKKIEISSGSPFGVVLVLYEKYSHLNR